MTEIGTSFHAFLSLCHTPSTILDREEWCANISAIPVETFGRIGGKLKESKIESGRDENEFD